MREPSQFAATLYVIGCIIGSVTSSAAAAPPQLPTKIGASAVWQIPQQFMTSAHIACDKSVPSGFAECVIDHMAKAGASADAVSFTHELYKQSHGDVGIMTGFQAVGPVDIAWITYPLRANTNYGLLLVNGKPQIVNVEDLNLLDRKPWNRVLSSRTLSFNFPRSTCGRVIATGRLGPTRKWVRMA